MQEKEQKISPIKQRILLFADNLNISMRDFYARTGISRGTLESKTSITEVIMAKFIATYPKVNIDWLITGNGTMTKDDDPIPTKNTSGIGRPYYNVDFIAGFDLVMNDQTRNPEFFIDFEPYNQDKVIWCNITGNSMEPELNPGDIIAIKEMTTPIEYLPTCEIYALVTDEFRTVKRIKVSKDNTMVTLIPTNIAKFGEQTIPTNLIRKVFAVLGCIHRLF